MANTVGEVMARNPVCLDPQTTLNEAARQMAEQDIGNVLVADDAGVQGIVTDRDIVVRALAQDRDPARTSLGDICSTNVVTVAAGDSIAVAADLMAEHAVRRLPVIQDGRPVGVVSLGDLAIEKDEGSALAAISAADENV